MDFTPELSAFQGAIISADNVQSFSKLSSKGGNEENVEYVINSLCIFLEKQNYINENGLIKEKESTMRKFALYFVLNADISILEEMVEMEGINTVIWNIPTIPKYLLSEMLWNLYMEKFVYEIISFCNPQLSIEVVDALVDNFKYFTPETCLDKLKIVSEACYRLLCRLHLFNFDNKVIGQIITSACNNLQKCFNYFVTPPNELKFNRFDRDELYKYKGKCLHTMLSLIWNCLEQYSRKQEFNFDEIYLLTFKIDSLGSASNKSEELIECLNKTLIDLLDKCKALVMDVSVDIFCAWSEFEEDGKSMQHTIGELCYDLQKKLRSIESVADHPLVSMIEQIVRKPVVYEEIINSTNTDTIMANIQNNSNKEEWIRALLHKGELCQDANLIIQLTSNLEVLNPDECCSLCRICQSYLSNHSENKEDVELLLFKAFQHCNNDDKHKLVEERFNKGCFYDMAETLEFNDLMTETFNKLAASPDTDLHNILNTFIQSPRKVFMRIFLMATENSQQTDIMMNLMKFLDKYSNHYYNDETEACIVKIAQIILDNHLDTDSKVDNFVKFISNLKSSTIISGTKVLLLIVMPNLHKALLSNVISNINIQCQLLSNVYTLEELKEYRAPMLAMLAQVLEVVRWKIDTYVALGPKTLEHVLRLQTKLFETYNGNIPENEARWLRSKLTNLQPLNSYYFRMLWNKTQQSFLEYVTGMTVQKDMDTLQLAAWLSLIICSSTQTEWCYVWENLLLYEDTMKLDILHKILVLLKETESQHHTESSWGCLLNCYKNFVYITRYKFFKEPLTDNQISTVVNVVSSLTNVIKENNLEDVEPILLPLFAYMMERRKDYTIDVAYALNNALAHKKMCETVNKVFSNGV